MNASPTSPCPCGSGERLGACCGPFLSGEPAPSVETVMRSRYTAHVLGDGEHLLRTWHPRTRPRDVRLDPATTWLGLDVLRVEAGGPGDETGVVEFEARLRDPGGAVETLHEVSRFARRGGRWVYVDAVD